LVAFTFQPACRVKIINVPESAACFRKGASAQVQWESSAHVVRNGAPYWNTGSKPSIERTTLRLCVVLLPFLAVYFTGTMEANKTKGLAKIRREIKRPFKRKLGKTLGISLRSLIKHDTNKNYLSCCCIEQTNDLDIPNVLRITRDDYLFPFYVRNNASDVHVYKSVIECEKYDFIPSREVNVIIDAGANIGLASVYFAKKFPNAKIISIEPENNNYFFLEQNTKSYSNITTIQAALWDKVGEIELPNVSLDSWDFNTSDASDDGELSVPTTTKLGLKMQSVKTVTVESLLSDYSLGTIDVLKIDIEGAEKEVFQNHSSWINDVSSIIVELHERMKRGCEAEFGNIAKKFDEVAVNGDVFYLSKNGFIKMK